MQILTIGKVVILTLCLNSLVQRLGVAGENLVRNPGFEQGGDGWDFRVARRSDIAPAIDLAIDDSTAHTGKVSARLTLDFESRAQFFRPVQKVKLFPDTEYLLSAYVKTELTDGAVHLELQDVRGWKRLLKGSFPLRGRSDWIKLDVPFRTSLTTEAVRIGLRHIGREGDKTPVKGRVWLDDVVLRERGSGVPRLSPDALKAAIENSKRIVLENYAVRIAFAEPRLRVRQILFKSRPSLALLPGPFPELPLYSIRLENMDGRVEEVRSLHALSVEVEQVAPSSYLLSALHDRGVRSVRVRVTLSQTGHVDLSLTDVRMQPGWRVTEIMFPQIVTRGVLGKKPEDTFVGGERPISLVDGYRFRAVNYPTSSRVPLLYQYGTDGGIYLMVLDPEQRVKTLELQPLSKRIGAVPSSIAWRCDVKVGAGDAVPRQIVRIGPIEQSAYEAAEVYRDWAETQPWCPKPLTQRRDIGEWRLRGVPHYFIYLPESGPKLLTKPLREMTRKERVEHVKQNRRPFRLKEVPDVMRELPREISELGGVVDLRGWEKWGLWMNPDWWPPRQGEDVLRKATEAIHQAGLNVTADVMFYNLNIQNAKGKGGFGEDGMRALESLNMVPENVAMIDQQGNLVSGGAAQYRGNIVCPTATAPRQHAVRTLIQMKNAGFDDVQFDGGGMEITKPCFSRKHTHPRGYGCWQTEVAREYLDRVRDAIPEARQTGFGFLEEYFNEVRLHSYVAVYTRCEQMRNLRARAMALTRKRRTPLPSIFSFVYHGRMVETGFLVAMGRFPMRRRPTWPSASVPGPNRLRGLLLVTYSMSVGSGSLSLGQKLDRLSHMTL